MLENISIRKATPEDAKDITNVYLASRKHFLPYATLAHSDERIYDWLRHLLTQNQPMFVAVDSGAIVGMMILANRDHIGWIDQLYLLPEKISLGIGSILLETAKAELGSPIRLHTFQENRRALHFYERHGFRILSLNDGRHNEEHCAEALLEWSTEDLNT